MNNCETTYLIFVKFVKNIHFFIFQLFTAAVLLYACLSAIYYAKFNPIIPDYSLEYDDYFLERSAGRKARSVDVSETPSGLSWINPTTFQFILDALSKHYEEQ